MKNLKQQLIIANERLDAVMLRAYEAGVTQKELAEIIGVSRGRVNNRLFKHKHKMKWRAVAKKGWETRRENNEARAGV